MQTAPTNIIHSKLGHVGYITPRTEDGLTLFWVEFTQGPFFDIHVEYDIAVETAQTVVRDFLNDPNWENCVK